MLHGHRENYKEKDSSPVEEENCVGILCWNTDRRYYIESLKNLIEPSRAASHLETELNILSVAVSHSLNFIPTLPDSAGNTTAMQTEGQHVKHSTAGALNVLQTAFRLLWQNSTGGGKSLGLVMQMRRHDWLAQMSFWSLIKTHCSAGITTWKDPESIKL